MQENTYQKNFVFGHFSRSAMIEKWKKSVDNSKTFTALLTDLSKAFGCFPHDFIINLIAK